jgi:4-hydroxybenzoate polyprenyltransferase
MTTRTIAVLIGDIKILHTIFALPFALIATLLAVQQSWPSPGQIALIILCMFGARTWAMAINRIADARFDAANPRTALRALPRGAAGPGQMMAFALFGASIFVTSAGLLSQLALACSVPVLVILASYSYAKRITWICHFWLGLCLGLAPVAAWLAIRGTLNFPIALLGTGVMMWVSGFDIVYAMQDEDFDRRTGLRSIPATFGRTRALWIARVCHVLALGFFGSATALLGLGPIVVVGLAVAAGLLLWQHLALAEKGNQAIPFAFFNLNAWVAIVLLAAVVLDLTIRRGLLP